MTSSLTALDVTLIFMLVAFAAWGFANGFIKAVGAIIGLVVGAAVASRFYLPLASLAAPLFGPYQNIGALASYAFIFLIVARLFGIVVMLFEKMFDLLAVLPFLKSINRLIGTVFGVVFGVIFLGTMLYIIGKYSPWTTFNDMVVHSQVAQYLITSTSPVRLLYPQELLALRSYF